MGSPSYSAFSSYFATAYTNPNPFTPTSFSQCDGNTNGKCNSSNILVFYNTFITNFGGSPPVTADPGPTDTSFYAAGICSKIINGLQDWYLPSKCEMDNSNASVCLGEQDMAHALTFLLGDPGTTTPSTSCNPPQALIALLVFNGVLLN